MKSNSLVFRKFVYLIFFVALCSFVFSSTVGVALGQKKPGSLNQGTTSDDKVLCAMENNSKGDNSKGDNSKADTSISEFCGLYNKYKAKKDSSPEAAKIARNEMIDLVEWQIEIYYKSRKDDRKKMVAVLQMIFDVLEIGSAAAAGIINGTLRAKSVIAQALSGFQAGRTAFNKNFDILQTQVLINTMNSNRAEIASSIMRSKRLEVDEYTWYAAKRDLTKLLNAGTFSDALDTLVKKTGDEAADSEKELAELKEKNGIVGKVSTKAKQSAADGMTMLSALAEASAAAEEANDAAKQKIVIDKYKKIYDSIKANEDLLGEFNKIPDNPNFSEDFREKLKGIIGNLAMGNDVTADDYDNVLTKFNRAVAENDALSKAFLDILKANK